MNAWCLYYYKRNSILLINQIRWFCLDTSGTIVGIDLLTTEENNCYVRYEICTKSSSIQIQFGIAIYDMFILNDVFQSYVTGKFTGINCTCCKLLEYSIVEVIPWQEWFWWLNKNEKTLNKTRSCCRLSR